jgi:anti-anti-sigma factor
MTSNQCDTLFTGAALNASRESTEIAGLTELVRGHDQEVLDRPTPLVQRQSLILDLHAVDRIDAAGIAVLISLYRSASDAGHRFTVANASPHVAEILAIVGLDRVLTSHNVVCFSHSGAEMTRSAA